MESDCHQLHSFGGQRIVLLLFDKCKGVARLGGACLQLRVGAHNARKHSEKETT